MQLLRTVGILSMLSVLVATKGQMNNHWQFGHNVSIDFSSGNAVVGIGPIDALEGTAAASDMNGNLLFSTEGTTIWDRFGNPMPNGTGLLGGASSTQAALIVPQPEQCGIYYVFTTEDHFGDGDLHYSVVDMCLNGGSGDVINGQKNILVATDCSEKLTAVPHDNGTDFWIITHQLGGSAFRAFQLTSTGLVGMVVSTVGSFHGSNCMIGPLKASHDGEHLVCMATFCNICELFDFDASTGLVSSPQNLVSLYNLPGGFYGAEFSPSGDVLYLATTWGTSRLYQLDLMSSTITQLQSIPGNYMLGALQLAPDGRIYMARTNQPFLDVVQNPDLSGGACAYTVAGLSLAPGTTSDIGMHNVVPAFAMQSPAPEFVDLGADTNYCGAQPFALSAPSICGATYSWQDGSSLSTMPVNGPGVYWVEVTGSCGQGSDTIVVDAGFSAVLPPLNGCAWAPLTIVASVLGSPSVWAWDFGDGGTSTAPGDQVHTYLTEGFYTVSLIISDSLGACSDTVQTTAIIGPPETAGPDTLILVCDTDPPFSLMGLLSPLADVNGIWLDSTGAPAPIVFDPTSDGSSWFMYAISGVHCGPDTAYAFIDVQVCMGVGSIVGSSLLASPNPVHGEFLIRSERLIQSLRLIDGVGRTVHFEADGTGRTRTVNTSGLSDGHYVLMVVLDTGELISKKLMVQHD